MIPIYGHVVRKGRLKVWDRCHRAGGCGESAESETTLSHELVVERPEPEVLAVRLAVVLTERVDLQLAQCRFSPKRSGVRIPRAVLNDFHELE
jgi:hypothetical protein